MIGYNLNDNFGLKDGGYSNSENTIDLPRHRWYYYKEGFSPFLVENAIEHAGVSKDDTILDPFNGGGTTTLTASALGLQSFGIEVNPFTAFLANTKLKNVGSNNFRFWRNEILSGQKPVKKSPLLGYSTFSQREGISKWLFNEGVLNAFESKLSLLNSVDDSGLRDIFRLALITSAIENSNARRDGKCFRYKGDWQNLNYNSETFNEALEKNLDVILEDLERGSVSQRATIINGDARKVLQSERLDKFKLCITSPPYLNTFDYTDIYRPELFLGGFVKSSNELYDLRLKTVRSHVQARWENPIKKDFGTLYEKAIEHTKNNLANLMHKNIPLMIQAYFEDMHNMLTSLKNHAKNDAQLWFVVSNSAYAGMEIPVDLIIGDIGSRTGWYLKEIGVLRYINKRKTKHSPDILTLRESVIIFSRKKP